MMDNAGLIFDLNDKLLLILFLIEEIRHWHFILLKLNAAQCFEIGHSVLWYS